MRSQKTATKDNVEILIVEDSPTQAEQLKHLLEERDYKVTVATNGSQALAAVHQRKPTLIISDILMPEMDGYLLCKEIKAQEHLKDIPVVLLTSLSNPQDVIRGLYCGADNFIRKPYDGRYLLSRVEYILANRKLRNGERVQMGLEIYVAGEKHFITAERQQILDLLISTYEEAVYVNEELDERQKELARSNQWLNGLYRMAESLNRSTSEQSVVEQALQQALELPGIQAGWITLLDEQAGFRVAAARGLPPALSEPGVLQSDCVCRRKLLSGELDHAMTAVECDLLQKAGGDTRGLRYHANILLWSGGRTLGILNLMGPEQKLFSENDLKILHGVGNQIGVALERAQLYEHMEKKVEERTAALHRSQEHLRQAQKMEAIGQLAGGVAHDFNNLLTVIIGFSELLMGSLDAHDPLYQNVEEIKKAGMQAATLTRQLLAFSRKQVMQPRILSLNEVVTNMGKMLRRLIGEDIDLIIVPNPALGHVKADPGGIEQIIMNLAVNARDAMPRGGKLTIETANVDLDETYSSEHFSVVPGRYVMLAVSDNGCGMDQETLSHIFEPFFTTKEQGKGTGLGLATVYGIVKQSGGNIWVYSEPQKGTTFKVYLPLSKDAVERFEPSESVEKPTRGSETILLVDDAEAVRLLARDVLRRNGYNVLEARNGGEVRTALDQALDRR